MPKKQDTDSLLNDIVNNIDIDSGVPPVEIDTEGLNSEAVVAAHSMVDNFCKTDDIKQLIITQPTLKKQIDNTIESLRLLVKMRKADEITHDMAVKAIGQNCTNASMYSALTKQQAQLISIQNKIDETLASLQALLKNYQMEFNFTFGAKDEEMDVQNNHCGAKEFLKSLEEKDKENAV